MDTETVLKKFINLNDEQKLAVIQKLDNIKEYPAEVIYGLKWLYEMSKTETQEKMLEYIKSIN